MHNEFDYFGRLVLIETLKFVFAAESNLLLFLNKSNTNTIGWNVKQTGDFRGKILPAWLFGEIHKFS